MSKDSFGKFSEHNFDNRCDKCSFTLLIRSFKHKGLRFFWEGKKNHKLPADQIERIKQMLEVIDSAKLVPQDFLFFRSWKIHPLKGNLKGYWALTFKENRRVVFEFNGSEAFNIDYLDYH